MQSILHRFPKFSKILPVFAVIAFFAYGRTLYTFAFKLPSWLLFQTLGDVLSNLAYGLAYNLFESLAILSVLLAIAFLLPARFFKDIFVECGTWTAVFVLGSILVYFKYYSSVGPDFLAYIYTWTGATLLLAALVAYLGGRILFLKKIALWFSDRVVVFLFLLVPASLISLVIVIVRNIS